MFELSLESSAQQMSAKRYMKWTKVSKATATRDLQELVAKGIFENVGTGGRSTAYKIMDNFGAL